MHGRGRAQGQLKGEVKAVRVLRSRNGKIPPQAFSFCTEIRHVLVENGVKIVGEAAWRCCRQLQIVHLPDTVASLLHGAFSRCQQEAFYKCISLKEISTPPSLLYIARHAFAGCTHLRIILKQGKSSTWRGTYAQSNAFDKCEHFDKPTWLRVLPIDANDLWREDFLDPAPKASNASEAGEEQGRRR